MVYLREKMLENLSDPVLLFVVLALLGIAALVLPAISDPEDAIADVDHLQIVSCRDTICKEEHGKSGVSIIPFQSNH